VHPDWLGNPQHFVAGFLIAFAVSWVAPRIGITNVWVAAALAIGVVMTAEAAVELVEYPFKYSDDPNVSAYLDTVADLANSLAGAVAGSIVGIALRRRVAPPRNRAERP
jgi:uncharacterized membrane protein YjdF